jgi:nitrate/nitrite transport system substrate-binding protein
MLEACRWLDGEGNRRQIAQWLARPEMLGVDASLIAARLEGDAAAPAPGMKFFEEGRVNYPRESEGVWFLTQFERWGMLARRDDYREIARALNQTALYGEAAAAIGIEVPQAVATAPFVDARVWDGEDAVAYVEGFPIRA